MPIQPPQGTPAQPGPALRLATDPANSVSRNDIGDATPGVSASSPLDLRLPPGRNMQGSAPPPSPARQAVEAQIGRSAYVGLESRMAHRLEADWKIERLEDGRVRMRRGEACVMLSETQASQLDPWNNRGTTPRNAGPCGND